MRTELIQSAVGEEATEDHTQERTMSVKCLGQRGNRTLDFLSLISGVFRVPAPCCLNERFRATPRVIGSALLDHVVEIVSIPVQVGPLHFLVPVACGAGVLVVQVQTELNGNREQGFVDRLFQFVTDDLAELVGR